jgi:hypothetical protein
MEALMGGEHFLPSFRKFPGSRMNAVSTPSAAQTLAHDAIKFLGGFKRSV